MSHFTWLKDLPAHIHSHAEFYPETEKLIWAVLLCTVLIVLGRIATSDMRAARNTDELILAQHHSKLFHFFDFFVESFIKYHDSILGEGNRRYVPLTGAIFTFLLFSNLIGLIPGVAAITTTVWVNVALALIVFVYFNYEGIRAHGVVGYLKHFCGPVVGMMPTKFSIGALFQLIPLVALAAAIFMLEILSTTLRILTLNLRLYWNINADHIVLETFTDLTKYVVPCIFYALGTFVSFMQAFVFITLTMIYILLATQHEEEH